MSDSRLQELEAKLAATFETGDWNLDSEIVVGEADLSEIEQGKVRPINMDLVPLGGSRPRAH